MFKQTAALAILSTALLATGCSDDDTRVGRSPAGPSAPQLAGIPSFSIQPSPVSPQIIGTPLCPELPPFLATINLRIQADGFSSLLLTEVGLRFVDSSGLAAPQITLPAPVLSRQFGTLLVDARSGRTFPFDFRFGCGTGRFGTIVVDVETKDKDGRGRSDKIRLSVR
jgi:hypothetical protein